MQQIKVLQKPSCSSDLNKVKNICSSMTRKVYGNNWQCSFRDELKASDRNTWFEIESEIMQNLIFSMETSISELRHNGSHIKFSICLILLN